jgi:hypothetical protein
LRNLAGSADDENVLVHLGRYVIPSSCAAS